MTVTGKAKPNQEAKFTTLTLFGKSLKEEVGCCVTLPGTHQAPFPRSESTVLQPLGYSRVDLALQHQVGSGTSQCGEAPNAG